MDYRIIDEQSKLKSHIQGIYFEMERMGINNIEEDKEFGQILLSIGKHNEKDIDVMTKEGIDVPSFQDTYIRMRMFRKTVLEKRKEYLEEYLDNYIHEEDYDAIELIIATKKALIFIEEINYKLKG